MVAAACDTPGAVTACTLAASDAADADATGETAEGDAAAGAADGETAMAAPAACGVSALLVAGVDAGVGDAVSVAVACGTSIGAAAGAGRTIAGLGITGWGGSAGGVPNSISISGNPSASTPNNMNRSSIAISQSPVNSGARRNDLAMLQRLLGLARRAKSSGIETGTHHVRSPL